MDTTANLIPKRRPLVTAPGESLLLLAEPWSRADRFQQMVDATGLDPDLLFDSDLLSMPLPLYFGVPDGRRRWQGVRPDVLWCPLFWLPERLAKRAAVTYPDGSRVLETGDQWALRVALEMSAAGMYDPDSGEWFDVLAAWGLDITDDVDWARVSEWLDGAADPVLDEVSLDAFFATDDDGVFHAMSRLLEPTLRGAMWSHTAGALTGLVGFLADPASGDVAYRSALFATVCDLGGAVLAEPSGGGDPDVGRSVWESCRRVADGGDLVSAAAEADGLLKRVADEFEPLLVDYLAFLAEASGADSPDPALVDPALVAPALVDPESPDPAPVGGAIESVGSDG